MTEKIFKRKKRLSVKKVNQFSVIYGILIMCIGLLMFAGCGNQKESDMLSIKISLVNAPDDIVTLGADYIAKKLDEESDGKIKPRVYHSGVLSGGKGMAEIEMCQQGSIEMHITTTAYLANMVPRASIFSLPFMFRDIDQITGFAKSHSSVLDTINNELNKKKLHIIAWWPRGFRQLTNSRREVRKLEDFKGLTLRVMNNPLFVDNIHAMGGNPVPMAWGEVYNALQLKTIDGQENAEDVIYSSKLYEVQDYMTIWDYSTDLEVVLVNIDWWRGLSEDKRELMLEVAEASIDYQADLLVKNTRDLREKLAGYGLKQYTLNEEEKRKFKEAVVPVWDKYEKIFKKPFLEAFLEEINKY